MFGNNLMTALVTLKTMADQQSVWGSLLKKVFVLVQCMRPYTENSSCCTTVKYTNIGGRRQYTTQCWKPPFLPDEPLMTASVLQLIWYHNWLYWYHNWPYRYTDYSTPFPGKLISIRIYAINDSHWVFFRFSFQETRTETFSSSHARGANSLKTWLARWANQFWNWLAHHKTN